MRHEDRRLHHFLETPSECRLQCLPSTRSRGDGNGESGLGEVEGSGLRPRMGWRLAPGSVTEKPNCCARSGCRLGAEPCGSARLVRSRAFQIRVCSSVENSSSLTQVINAAYCCQTIQ